MSEAILYEKHSDSRVRLPRLPVAVQHKPGKYGVCRTRRNTRYAAELNYGKVSSAAADPSKKNLSTISFQEAMYSSRIMGMQLPLQALPEQADIMHRDTV
jgi:hypothetical protein